MGGNAFKSLSMARLPAKAYHALSTQLTEAFHKAFPAVRIEVIPAYRSKEDFGDLDVLVASEPLEQCGGREAIEAFARQFGHARSFLFNGDVVSFDYRCNTLQQDAFQIDLIRVPEEGFDAALVYFSFNDLGNLMGRIAHKMGFSYGHESLTYPFREGTHLFRRLSVSRDPWEAMRFLGYSPARHRKGFDTPEDIFSFAASTPYFNPDIFLLENRSHKARTRDRKRKMYSGFLEWMAAHPGLPRFPFPDDKDAWLPMAFENFPVFAAAYEQAARDLIASRRIREVFNGQKVGEWSGLSGKELGQLMSEIRQAVGDQHAWLNLIDREGEPGVRALVTRHQHRRRHCP